jgi:hypothetical protein
MKLVGFCGLMGSGKTFAADYLVEKYGYTKVKFAKPLKDMLRAMGLTEAHIEGDLKELPCDLLDGRTPRWAMQTLGTEWGRELISENLWGNLWEQEVRSLLSKGKRVVVDDCRFDNEAQRIQKMSGFLIRMVGSTGIEETSSGHPSENIPQNPNATLLNPKDDHAPITMALDSLIAIDNKKSGRPWVSQGGFAVQ